MALYSRDLALEETEEQVIARITAAMLSVLAAEARRAGVAFEPESPEVKERIDLAIVETLDEMGFCQPPQT